uniref:Uncharacterized protein n=1 Tax=Anguilla anguilla TaxID=7936 RepID=A0A0E9XLT8_ANGAN
MCCLLSDSHPFNASLVLYCFTSYF